MDSKSSITVEYYAPPEAPDEVGEYSASPQGSDMSWKPLVLTHVEYVKGDWIGILFALSSLGPLTLITSFVTITAIRRDLHTISFFIGFLLMEPINYALKISIRQPRPFLVERRFTYGDYGMPSSHSQHSWFFAIYSILFILIRLDQEIWENAILISLLVISSAWVSYGRVYLKYHTWMQILMGGLLGSILGVSWFAFVHLVLTPCFPSIVAWKISEFLLIRDTTRIPHLLQFEYDNVIRATQPSIPQNETISIL